MINCFGSITILSIFAILLRTIDFRFNMIGPSGVFGAAIWRDSVFL